MAEESISIKIFEAATDKAIDKGLDELIVAVGLSDNPPDLEAYFNQILSKLEDISTELQHINQTLYEIQDAQSLMRIQIQDVAFQNILSELVPENNYVKTSFDYFYAATNKILTGQVEAGADDLYNHVLEYDKIFELSNTLGNIETYWLGEGSLKGVFYYLGELLKSNLETKWIEDKDKGKLNLKDQTVPDYFGVIDLYPESYANTLEQEILAEFNSCLTILVKGIMILEVAYRGTSNQHILNGHYEKVQEITTLISTFLKDNTKADDINDFLEGLVRHNFKRCKDSFPETLFNDYTWWCDGAPGDGPEVHYDISTYLEAFFPVRPLKTTGDLYFKKSTCFLIGPDFQFGVKTGFESPNICELDDSYSRVIQSYRSRDPNGFIDFPINQAPTLVPPEEYSRLSAALEDIYALKIGDEAYGGIVVFVDDSGKHGLVAAKENLGKFNLSDAKIKCSELVIGNFSDWYLPTKVELNLMYENLHKVGIGGFDSMYYWSSTEANTGFAWLQDFSLGFQYEFDKGRTYRVRAVRAF